MLLSLPSEILQLLLWKCSVHSMLRLARTCKHNAALAKSVAPQMLADICAAAATSRAAAASGAFTLQRLAWFCRRRPRVPYKFWGALELAIRERANDMVVEYDALELIFLVFHDAEIRSEHTGSGIYEFKEAINEAFSWRSILGAFLNAVVMYAQSSASHDEPCGFGIAHIRFEHVRWALAFVFQTPTGCATSRKSLKRAAPEAVAVMDKAVDSADVVTVWSPLVLSTDHVWPDDGHEDDDDSADVIVSAAAMETIDRRDAERDPWDAKKGVAYYGTWYDSVTHVFDEPYAFFYGRKTEFSGKNWCGSRLCCHRRCNCRLADAVFHAAITEVNGEDDHSSLSRPQFLGRFRQASWSRLSSGCDLDLVSEVAHGIACDLLEERGRPCSCPMVLETQRKWASYQKWRRAGLAPTPTGEKCRAVDMLSDHGGVSKWPPFSDWVHDNAPELSEPSLQHGVTMPQSGPPSLRYMQPQPLAFSVF
jgi:hypothetical protein